MAFSSVLIGSGNALQASRNTDVSCIFSILIRILRLGACQVFFFQIGMPLTPYQSSLSPSWGMPNPLFSHRHAFAQSSPSNFQTPQPTSSIPPNSATSSPNYNSIYLYIKLFPGDYFHSLLLKCQHVFHHI